MRIGNSNLTGISQLHVLSRSQPTRVLSRFSKDLRRAILVLLAIGIGFRCFHLDHKIFWHDEALGALRIAGYTTIQMVREVFDGPILAAGELLQRYQYPNAKRDLTDAIEALAGSPEHAPLYYLTARFWFQLWGRSVATFRSLSMVASLLVFPCLYWLGRELFDGGRQRHATEVGATLPTWAGASLATWLTLALVAVSPFHVLYAQEARQYSLWTVAVVLSSAALLRAVRVRSLSSWLIYGLTVALNLYSHIFSIFVLLGHGIYLLLLGKEAIATSQSAKPGRSLPLVGYSLGISLGLLLFTPWLVVMLQHFSKLTENTATLNIDRPFGYLYWLLNLNRLFFDVNQGYSLINITTYATAGLTIYSFYWLYRQAPRKIWLFIITLAGVTALALLLPDLVLGGRRSMTARYAIPCYLAIELAIAYLLAIKLTATEAVRRRWQKVAIVLAVSGVLSCGVSSQNQVWWNKGHDRSLYNPNIAKIVNSSIDLTQPNPTFPLVISDDQPGTVLAMSHQLYPQVKWQLLQTSNNLRIPPNTPIIFAYRPSRRLRAALKQLPDYEVEAVLKNWLWKLNPR